MLHIDNLPRLSPFFIKSKEEEDIVLREFYYFKRNEPYMAIWSKTHFDELHYLLNEFSDYIFKKYPKYYLLAKEQYEKDYFEYVAERNLRADNNPGSKRFKIELQIPGKPKSKYDVEKIKYLHQKGFTQTEIAKLFDTIPSTISRIINYGIVSYKSENKKKNSSKFDIDLVKKMYADGKTQSEIAKALNYTTQTVNWIVKRRKKK